MKKKIITYGILALIGVGIYFGYEHFFGCKGTCEESCESKDSVAVSATPTVATNDSCTVKDTTKK